MVVEISPWLAWRSGYDSSCLTWLWLLLMLAPGGVKTWLVCFKIEKIVHFVAIPCKILIKSCNRGPHPC